MAKLPGVQLIQADYESEDGLRKAFAGQDACFFNMNTFSVGEAREYFWTFRAYEIAVQSKLKLFVLSGAKEAQLKEHGYDEHHRNSHNVVKERLTDWLTHQPLSILPWTVISGGVYAQMLSSLLRPQQKSDGVYEFRAPIGNGAIPFINVDDYGVMARYVFENPGETIGKLISWGVWYTTYPELATAFQNATGKRATFKNVTQDQWFEDIKSSYVDPEIKMPRGVDPNDKTAFTFRKTFGAWWNLWKDVIRHHEEEKLINSWSDRVSPTRMKSLEEWMIKTNYTGTGSLTLLDDLR